MIIFLTLVGACHSYKHNLPFLGWLIHKMHSNALRFYSASLHSPSFAFISLPFFSLFSVFRVSLACVCVFALIDSQFSFGLAASLTLFHVMPFHVAVIISHFIVYLYHGARTLYFISRKNCVIHVSLLSDMTFFTHFRCLCSPHRTHTWRMIEEF